VKSISIWTGRKTDVDEMNKNNAHKIVLLILGMGKIAKNVYLFFSLYISLIFYQTATVAKCVQKV